MGCVVIVNKLIEKENMHIGNHLDLTELTLFSTKKKDLYQHDIKSYITMSCIKLLNLTETWFLFAFIPV